ncbi:hypothetical protein KGQ72_00935 [Patescibacteria group bacterium]|nr:hypothetical protein [Patescibacteria group bacterium]
MLYRASVFFKRLRSGERHDPVRDWLTIVAFSSIMLAGIIVWNVWAFDTVASGGAIGAPASATAPLFSRASLDAIHTIFTDRADEEAKYVTGVYRYADPSL